MFVFDFLRVPPPTEHSPSLPPQASYLAEYVLYPFYDWIVQYYPTSWSPNKVTLVGIFSTLLASLLLLTAMPPDTAFDPPYVTLIPSSLILHADAKWRDAAGPTPLYPTVLCPFFSIFSTSTSLLFVCGVLNVIYCMADNTDGRLARRLNKASNIGEYLDHGLDCVTSLLSTTVTLSVLGISFSNIAFTVFLVAVGTILSHTLHYEMNMFIWGNRFVSVDEAMIFFCAANWIPILFPRVGMATLPSVFLDALLPQAWASFLLPLRGVDVALVVYWVSQLYVVAGIVIRKWEMFFRFTTIALVCNALLLFSIIPYHTTQIMLQGSSSFSWGPFSYAALWFITMASTCSTIVHILIYARCASLKQVSPSPLAGILCVHLAFLGSPAIGMLMSVVWHALQIVSNVRHFQYGTQRSSQKLKAA